MVTADISKLEVTAGKSGSNRNVYLLMLGLAVLASAALGLLSPGRPPLPLLSSQPIRFGAGQDGNVALVEGWSSPDAGGCWSDGHAARLKFVIGKLPRGPGRLRLLLWVQPFLAGGLLHWQQIEIVANQSDPISVIMSGVGFIAVPIDDGSVQPGDTLEVRIILPDAESPQVLGQSTDPRKLGISLQSARLESIAVPAIERSRSPASPSFPTLSSRPVEFGAGRDGNAALVQGWSSPDADGCWSDGHAARLKFVIGRVLPGRSPLGLVLQVWPFLARNLRQQRLEITLNDSRPTLLAVSETGAVVVPLVAGSAKPGDTLEVGIKLPDADSPRNLGMGTDPRLLGINLESACLRDLDPPN